MDRGDQDRRQILRRRAALVGSALAALGCSPAAGTGKATAPPVAVPEASGAAGGEPASPPKKEGGTAFGEARPPLSIPAGVSSAAQEHWEHLVQSIDKIHAAADEIQKRLSERCNVTDSGCEDEWRAISQAWLEIDEVKKFMYFCPGSSEEAKAFAEEEQRQREYAERRLSFLKSEMQAQLAGAGAEKRWQEIDAEVRSAHPMVCLSFGCNDW